MGEAVNRRLVAGSLVVALVIGGCTGGTAPAASPAPAGGSASPSAMASLPTANVVNNPAHGLGIAFPADWVVVTPELAADPTALASLKTSLGGNGSVADEAASAISRHPEYWFAAAKPGASTAVGYVVTNDSGADWVQAEQAALAKAYGTVTTAVVSSPRPGSTFSMKVSGMPTRLYGFERPGGHAILIFSSPDENQSAAEWDDIVATFTDLGS